MKRIVICIAILMSSGVCFESAHSQTTTGCDLTAWIFAQQPHSTRTPEIFPPQLRDTVIVVNGASHKISIPAGFTMTVFAKVPTARGLALSSDGVIYATSYNGNIYALPDHNHDGNVDSTIVVASGLGDPHGIGFYHGELYVSNNASVFHLPDVDHNRITENKELLIPLDGGGAHTSRNFVIDTLHKKFYIQIGSTSNLGPDTDDSLRATVVEANLDGSNRRIYSRGLRNAVGMDIDPRTGAVWVNNNGMDNMFGEGDPRSANNPSECVYILCDGANFGWPWAYGFRMRNPLAAFVDKDTNFIASLDGPVAEVLAHSAPLGLHFYRGATLPFTYHNAIFQSYHGSWNRNPPAPPRVTVLWADADGKNARVTDFVNGFQPDSSGTRWGRPVSIIEGADSALYVSDDQAGVIYRIQWTGTVQTNLFIDNSNLSGRSFGVGEQVPVNWVSNNVDSVDVYFSSSAGIWTRIGGATKPPFTFSAIEAGTTLDKLKLVDPRSGTESISDSAFSIASLGVQPPPSPHFTFDALNFDQSRQLAIATFTADPLLQVTGDLYSITGQNIATKLSTNNTIQFDLSSLPSGSYIVRLHSGSTSISKLLEITH